MKKPLIHRLPLLGYTYNFTNWYEFAYLFWEIFLLDEYAFSAQTPQPVVVDCGGHIGLSTLYFKKKYPQAKITVFEPHPQNRALLKENLRHNHLKNVSVVPAAIGRRKGQADFHIPAVGQPSWGSSLQKQGQFQTRNVRVPVVRLSSFITQPVDLLKMDIEGAELEVIQELKPKLKMVHQVVIEVHDQPQRPTMMKDQIGSVLSQAGFQVRCYKPWRIKAGEWWATLVNQPTSNIFMIRATRPVLNA